MKTSEFLIAAKAHIDTPDKWCQGSSAKDKYGNKVYVSHSYACKFCSYGALDKEKQILLGEEMLPSEINDLHEKAEIFLCRQTVYIRSGQGLASFNDSHNHTEVMSMWDATIQHLQNIGD